MDTLRRSSAVMSPCGRYRYLLSRVWDQSLPTLYFGMLNPSTADGRQDDPTIIRCRKRAEKLGFGSIIVWNLFATRTTEPIELLRADDPVGSLNNRYIVQSVRECAAKGGKMVLAWGNYGGFRDRSREVSDLLRAQRASVFCLGLTAQGEPKHPLYVPYRSPLLAFELTDRGSPLPLRR